MSFEKSFVMVEFAKLLNDQMTKTAAKKEKEKNIIDEAHPEPVYTAESQGDGGLVENQNEQHKKSVEILNKMPTGSLVHRYASTALSLIKMANACDMAGCFESADSLTDAARELINLIDNQAINELSNHSRQLSEVRQLSEKLDGQFPFEKAPV